MMSLCEKTISVCTSSIEDVFWLAKYIEVLRIALVSIHIAQSILNKQESHCGAI
jgi:hypothetical protein